MRHLNRVFKKRRDAVRWSLAAIYILAGILHLSVPNVFMLIMPAWVPCPYQVIQMTGIFEIAGALGLVTRHLRKRAGIALAVYAVCVFPANIHQAIHGLPPGYIQLGWWYHIPRLALQPIIVWWALFAGEVTSWPFEQNAKRKDPPKRASL